MDQKITQLTTGTPLDTDYCVYVDLSGTPTTKKTLKSNLKGDKGDTGATGSTGTAATIAVGTTTASAPGGSASVINSGSSSAATFNFTIPRGQVGINWTGAWSGATAYNIGDAVSSGNSSYYCILGNTNNVPPNATYWNVIALKGVDGSGTVNGPGSSTDGAPALWNGTGGTTLKNSTPTGTGNPVLQTSPTLTTAVLGSSTATTQTPADNSTKLATTAYVDAAVLGQNFKEAALVATTANLVGVYLAGVFTYTATGTDTIDGVTLALGNRVLVKNQTTTFQNGIYSVTTAGALGVAGVLTRSSDANASNEFKTGDSLFITSGTANSNTTWAYTGVDSPTIGTDAITYAQTAGQGTVTSGNGITVTGLSVAIDTSVTVDKTTAQTLTNKTLTTPIINQVNASSNTVITMNAGTSNAIQTYTPSAAGTATLDLSKGNIHHITMPAGNITIALSNGVAGQCFIIRILQDGTGSRTVTWFTTIRWAAGGTAPTLTTTASKVDTVGFEITGSSTYDGFVVGQNI